jgi:hypothetical protein
LETVSASSTIRKYVVFFNGTQDDNSMAVKLIQIKDFENRCICFFIKKVLSEPIFCFDLQLIFTMANLGYLFKYQRKINWMTKLISNILLFICLFYYTGKFKTTIVMQVILTIALPFSIHKNLLKMYSAFCFYPKINGTKIIKSQKYY